MILIPEPQFQSRTIPFTYGSVPFPYQIQKHSQFQFLVPVRVEGGQLDGGVDHLLDPALLLPVSQVLVLHQVAVQVGLVQDAQSAVWVALACSPQCAQRA